MVDHPSHPSVPPVLPPKIDNTLPTPPKPTHPIAGYPEVNPIKEAEAKLAASQKKLEVKKAELDKVGNAANEAHMEYSNLLKEVATREAELEQAKSI